MNIINEFWNKFLPVQGTEWAKEVDFLNLLITNISLFCTLAITLTVIIFAIKYRRRPGNEVGEYILHNNALEITWTVIPTLICLFLFYYGAVVYSEMRNPPASATEISVVAQKWSWSFSHENGKQELGQLVVPRGRPVRLIMRSKDVLHSLFIPSIRVKEDIAKNRYSYLWFRADKSGEFPIFCTEYCGKSHSGMLATLKVVEPEEYQDYLTSRVSASHKKLTPIELGKLVYTKKGGCIACHSIDGSRIVGPTLKGVFGSKVECEDGSVITADENFIRESILNPNKTIVKGYQPIMPAFQGQLSDEEVDGLIAFIKSLEK